MSDYLSGSRKESKNPSRNPLFDWRVGATVVAAVVASSTTATHIAEKDSGRGVSSLKATEIAQEAVIAQRNASLLADSYTQRLSEETHPKGMVTPVFMQYLNGKIKVMTPSGAHKGGPPETYQDPILLSLANPNLQPDKDGKFLIGAWIGIESSTNAGSVVVEPVPYDNNGSMHFVPNNPNDVKSYITSAGVYPQSYDNSQGETVGYQLIGYDVAGNKALHNADGTAITPGRIEQP